jgi:1-acyl-sn-glycerol-3-phosphate acyltransferase
MLFSRFVRIILKIILFFTAKSSASGYENLPPEGPFIPVVNHMSVMDTVLLLAFAPPYRRAYMAGEKWEKVPILGHLMRWTGAIFINRGEVDRMALKQIQAALDDGKVLGLAPEGTRSKDGRLARPKNGAAYLALRSKAPLVPLGVVNTNLYKDNLKRLRRTPLEIHAGPPIHLPDIGRKPRGKDLDAYSHYIMVHIANQLPERHRGYYADSPALAALERGEDPMPACLEAEGAAPIGATRRRKKVDGDTE